MGPIGQRHVRRVSGRRLPAGPGYGRTGSQDDEEDRLEDHLDRADLPGDVCGIPKRRQPKHQEKRSPRAIQRHDRNDGGRNRHGGVEGIHEKSTRRSVERMLGANNERENRHEGQDRGRHPQQLGECRRGDGYVQPGRRGTGRQSWLRQARLFSCIQLVSTPVALMPGRG